MDLEKVIRIAEAFRDTLYQEVGAREATRISDLIHGLDSGYLTRRDFEWNLYLIIKQWNDKIKVKCEFCGKELKLSEAEVTSPSTARRKKQFYCNYDCVVGEIKRDHESRMSVSL